MKTLPLVSCFRMLAAVIVFAGGSTLGAADAPPKGDVPPSVLQRFDKNKNGKLDDIERAKWDAEKAQRRAKDAARRAEMVARFDVNKDGKIDADEGAVAKLAMAKERTEADSVKTKARMATEAAKRKAEAEVSVSTGASAKPAADSMMSDSVMGNTNMSGPAATPAPAPATDGDGKMMVTP